MKPIGLTTTQAIEIALEAESLLEKAGKVASIYICDRHQAHLISLTMGGVKLASTAIAGNKARQSAYTGKSTRQTRDGNVSPEVLGLAQLVPWAGGVPIYDEEGNLLGAIGVSNLSEDEDEQYATESVRKSYRTTK